MSDIIVPYLSALVKRLGKPLSVFDLEATAFRGSKNFGIVEVSICTIWHDDRRPQIYGSLINPENLIEPGALTTHGISQSMVKDQQTWGVRYAKYFHKIAKEHIISGFNIKTFDCPAVIEQNARYGVITEKFESVIDARHFYRHAVGVKGLAGSLGDFAKQLGLTPKGRLHRAEADVYLTVDMLEALVRIYGEEAFIEEINGGKPKARATGRSSAVSVTAELIAACVHQKGCADMAALCAELQCAESAVEFSLCQAIDRGLVDAMLFSHAETRHWLRSALTKQLTKTPFEGRLKPIFEALHSQAPAGIKVSYVQLRIALLDAGYTWGNLNQAKMVA